MKVYLMCDGAKTREDEYRIYDSWPRWRRVSIFIYQTPKVVKEKKRNIDGLLTDFVSVELTQT